MVLLQIGKKWETKRQTGIRKGRYEREKDFREKGDRGGKSLRATCNSRG